MEVVNIVLRVADWDLPYTGVQTILAKVHERNSRHVPIVTAWDENQSLEVGLAFLARDWWSGESLSISRVDFQVVKLCCQKLGFLDIWYFEGKKSFLPHDSNTWGVKS